MAAPNIRNVQTITGKTKGLALTTSAQDLLENPASSGKVFKVNVVRAANVDGSNEVDVTLSFVDATGPSTSRPGYNVTVPAKASLSFLKKDEAIYLEEGDKLTALASASGDAEMIVSYEEIS
jgi:hypothetical protein